MLSSRSTDLNLCFRIEPRALLPLSGRIGGSIMLDVTRKDGYGRIVILSYRDERTRDFAKGKRVKAFFGIPCALGSTTVSALSAFLKRPCANTRACCSDVSTGNIASGDEPGRGAGVDSMSGSVARTGCPNRTC